MTPAFPARKRAEEFSSLVEDPSTGELREGVRADLLPLVGVVATLRATPPLEARPEFVSDLRSRLMLAAETALAPDTARQAEQRRQPAPRRTARERRLAVAIGGFALVSASASMSVAAQTALPGDTLYPLKRGLEDVHAKVLRDADDKGSTMLDNATGRLDEVDELSRAGGPDATVITETLEDFSDQAVEASGVLLSDYEDTGRLSSLEEVRSFTAASLEALDRLQGLVPLEARASLVEAARVLDEIDARARTACPTCLDLPAVVGAVAAAADVGPLYEQLLDAVPTVRPPAPPEPSAPATKPPAQPTGEQAPSTGDPSPQPEVAQPDPPVLPTDGGGRKPPSLQALTNGITVDLGDLLTGTVEGTVGGTVGGVVEGLGGLLGDKSSD